MKSVKKTRTPRKLKKRFKKNLMKVELSFYTGEIFQKYTIPKWLSDFEISLKTLHNNE